MFFAKRFEPVVYDVRKPVGKLLTLVRTAEIPQDYEGICNELGVVPTGLIEMKLREQFKTFFAKQKIPIYEEKDVKEWMDKKANSEGKRWSWFPISAKDKMFSDSPVYTHPIPKHALEKALLISKEFGREKVSFQVTDYRVPNPDPFIRVVARQATMISFIFDFWDEPGFGNV